ncbi:GTP-binding protein LepA [Zeaxanthinibacter enoshimensis]|uniref:Elongation factor 4 n=2 Tax=Zeaxanthinibacter enoshimensis TaxID=392009 RepID=A0A4R6TRA3_9FLAO|nr:GTP-binding protein LepA [Zeaxanthinibacter enoshimensis]
MILRPEVNALSGNELYLPFLKTNLVKVGIAMKNIRNFCIIAHIDHGKSTLADRLLDFTGSVTEREKKAQLLDNMDLERERGITIKSHAIQMEYVYKGEKYILNLIDTPGHVDFSYEVSRSIAACEGALLVVDAAQSIQAQTISNLYLALENDLEIIPVLNKVDLPSANPEEVTDDIVDLLGCAPEDVIPASAKTGLGIEEILAAIIERVPAPSGTVDEPLQALVFDSVYNPFRGVETYFRVINGEIKKGQKIKFVATDKKYDADEVGTLKLTQVPKPSIKAGDVGYLITGIKDAREVKVGDTITDATNPTRNPIEGFEDVKPMVFAGIYPVDTEDFEELRSSMEKLQLNDASLVFTPESSAALGFGFRCGFLGMLHMEIVQERLEREFDMTVITTVPNVSYYAYSTKDPDEAIIVNNPSDLPDPSTVSRVEEPYIKATIITKADFVGNVMSLCIDKRGQITNQTYLTTDRVELTFDMPLAEIVFDFYDRLKTVSKGYASFDYTPIGMRTSKLVRVDILLNAQPVDALSALVHFDNAYDIGKRMCEKLKELIPRQQFDIPIQAAIGAKIISRETIKALRKDVTAKCYGGDISRKRKLLEKQKKGKKRMRQVGNVEIPQQAFMAVLKLND